METCGALSGRFSHDSESLTGSVTVACLSSCQLCRMSRDAWNPTAHIIHIFPQSASLCHCSCSFSKRLLFDCTALPHSSRLLVILATITHTHFISEKTPENCQVRACSLSGAGPWGAGSKVVAQETTLSRYAVPYALSSLDA